LGHILRGLLEIERGLTGFEAVLAVLLDRGVVVGLSRRRVEVGLLDVECRLPGVGGGLLGVHHRLIQVFLRLL
jgi:hypothetical protein